MPDGRRAGLDERAGSLGYEGVAEGWVPRTEKLVDPVDPESTVIADQQLLVDAELAARARERERTDTSHDCVGGVTGIRWEPGRTRPVGCGVLPGERAPRLIPR